jgi:hypothetical protein
MRLTSDRGSAEASEPPLPVLKLRELEGLLREGDVVFTRIPHAPFTQIADATGTWTNHVGIVVGFNRFGAVIAESRVPLSCRTLFAFFARRSAQGRVAVLRPHQALSEGEIRRLQIAVRRRLGRFYDTGFNIRSRRQFCSRFVREVLQESTGIEVGGIETFRDLLARNPRADLRLWKLWYFGHIPWERTTVTPASLYASPALRVVFDGATGPRRAARRLGAGFSRRKPRNPTAAREGHCVSG